ncbi:MAG: HDOD domain-containing protein [Planctomycetota bacterium]
MTQTSTEDFITTKKTVPSWTNNLESIPSLPTVAGRLMEMALNERSTSNELGELISKDPGLTAKLLQAVNSTSYGLRSEVTSVSHAISIIGRQALRSLVLGISVFDTMKSRAGSSADEREILWKHSVAAAAAAQWIAECVGKVNPEEAYIAGLTHDIGKVALDLLRPNEYKLALSLTKQCSIDLDRENESKYCELDHAEVGDLLAQRWSLPSGIRAAIKYHHDPAAAVNESTPIRRIIAITKAADIIAFRCGYPSVETVLPPEIDKITRELLSRVDEGSAVERVKAEVLKCREVFKYGESDQPEVWQKRLYNANAELSKAFASLGDSNRIQQKATELIVQSQRFLGEKDPVQLVLKEIVEKLGYERAYFLQLSDDFSKVSVLRLVSADGRGVDQAGRQIEICDKSFVPADGPLFITKTHSPSAEMLLRGLGVPAAVVTPIYDEGKLKYLLGTDRGMKGTAGSDSATVDVIAHQLFAPSFALLLMNDRLYKKAQYLSTTDVLTGISNRRALMERLDDVAKKSDSSKLLYCAAMFDIDFFKKFNDELGHLAGDDVLRSVAQTILSGCRADDYVGRYGGEEFCLILPNTPLAEGVAVAERVRTAVEAFGKTNAAKFGGRGVTVSGGIAVNKPGERIEALLGRADAAMYRAKQNGRNRLEMS